MTLLRQKPIVFKMKCDALFDEELLRKAILWKSTRFVQGVKFIYPRGGGRYPSVTIGADKHFVHRLIMSFLLGRELASNEHVHHKNHIKTDARAENLEVINSSVHMSMHNAGKTLSKSHRKKISDANYKRHRVNIPIDELHRKWEGGACVEELCRFYGVHYSTIKSRLPIRDEVKA